MLGHTVHQVNDPLEVVVGLIAHVDTPPEVLLESPGTLEAGVQGLKLLQPSVSAAPFVILCKKKGKAR